MRTTGALEAPRAAADKAELFAEAFNMTNYVNLDAPTGNLQSATFGQSTALATGAAPHRAPVPREFLSVRAATKP
ncbi:MAG: hypothetical protein AUH72_07030 [Acidobacteria bacterium 13_1_40CM_4_65_8]|nr:MAG: hypothetical protein AUH72_07030 [Acidobacteria bacterium 13_1_40CM_4_65_8]OLE82224.1 MAG: hypothetical protein AUF76_10335 [Acidobacteria bacterium 13_1_20CM_2_65_9]